ncbi:hypothetical protein [Amycolatopsis lexingtonensis]|uniref:hypothetical protein n=1 Tax=Amycolatopsis lexingtonensis TaxID=218822 RepID=UPI003F726543
MSLAAIAVRIRAHDTALREWSARHPDQPLARSGPIDIPAPAGDFQVEDAVDGFGHGHRLTDTVPGAELAAPHGGDRADEQKLAAPAWARPLVDETANWLLTGYTSESSRTTAANAPRRPRVDQRWHGEPTMDVPDAPNPLTFFPWCQRAGINPLTEMSRDRPREWLGAQAAAGVPTGTRKTTVNSPTAAFTLAQIQASRVAARTYRGRSPRETRKLVALRHVALVALMTTTGIRAHLRRGLRHDRRHAARSRLVHQPGILKSRGLVSCSPRGPEP